MKTEKYINSFLGEIVAEDFRTAEIFKNSGIDFCCGGKKTLEQACLDKNLDPNIILQKLKELEITPLRASHNFKDWELDFLSDYIVNIHHKYALKTIPDLVFYSKKIALVHGSIHPELIEVENLIAKLNTELLKHLKREEEVLFPAIKEALRANSRKIKATIISEIGRMINDHEFAGDVFEQIKAMTSNYRLPEDACNSYKVCFQLLEQFEDNLHIHIHLENNILYPKALGL
jgi:regulator of cell morphogenesis and NO signaling